MVNSKAIKKYVNFIDDDEFLSNFLPESVLKRDDTGDDQEPEIFVYPSSPPYISVKLRDYQLEGLNWLIKMHESGINCILADEMGLGKTLQSISLLGYVKLERRDKSKHLVVVPKSCLRNWENEFKRFVPDLNVLVFHTARADIKEEGKAIFSKKIDVVLTTYEMCLYGKSVFGKVQWDYVVVDEAHRLKNENSQLSQMLRMYNFKHRLLLTGTPLQNNIHELWALLNFIAPEVFADSGKFEAYVMAADQTGEEIEKLRNVLRLFFLRREKEDVEQTLLPKKIVNLYCPLSEMQRKWYKSILTKDMSGLSLEGNVRASLLNVIMQLKKCCNHPYLFPGAEPEPFETGEHLVTNSGKMGILDKLLRSLRQNGSRVLIFSQMAQMIDILEDYAVYREYEYCRIDGRTPLQERNTAIDEFNSPGSNKFLFLLTTRAGGLGINLYTADTVIIFDSDWNPQADLQAQDRAHRIGQKKQVHVFRLVTESSVEEGILLRAQQKLKLDDILIQRGQKRASPSLTQDEMMEILFAGLKLAESADQGVESNLSIEEVLKRGEDKTQEMNRRLNDYRIGDSADSKINMYQWEGENYAKRRLEEFIEENMPQRSVRGSFTATKAFKSLQFPDYQFYPREFYELQKKEEELFNRGEQLTEEEKARKEELLGMGFSWTKKDYKAFVAAIDSTGNDLEQIKGLLPHRKDVEDYYRVFWERYEELADAGKINGMLGRGKARDERAERLRYIFENHREGLAEHILSKNRMYSDNVLLLSFYIKHIDNPRCFEMVKAEIIKHDAFCMDYFLLTRPVQDLSKHINLLATQVLKSFEGV